MKFKEYCYYDEIKNSHYLIFSKVEYKKLLHMNTNWTDKISDFFKWKIRKFLLILKIKFGRKLIDWQSDYN